MESFAYISNYGGLDSDSHIITAIDLESRKQVPVVDLGALRSPHGLDFSGGKLYFTAETNKVIGRYDPAAKVIDWVMGTGQDRTHMVLVSPSGNIILTSNVSSGTISIIEQVDSPGPPGPPPGAPGSPGPPPGGSRRTWRVTNVVSGRGVEGFDLSPDGKQIWAANAQDDTVTIIDVASRQAVQTFPISAKHANRLKFTTDGKLALVSGLGAGPGSSGVSLAVIDVASRKESKQLQLGGGSGGILVSPDGARAYIAVSGANKVVVLDLKTLEVAGQIPTGKQPDGLAWAQSSK